jgi:hypothetical protein
VQHHSLCNYPALQECAFSVSLHEQLPATFINLCNGIGEKGKVFSVEVAPMLTTLTSRQQGRRERRNMYTQMYTGGQFWHLLPYSCFFKRTIPAKQIHSHRLLYCNRSEIMAMSYLEGELSRQRAGECKDNSSRIVLYPQLTAME